ncbi:MAG: ABC transporter ATP-binding protein [Firmicutes bacterium]|nr:ABC transporter ATP-binding protein [Bacillota bacterium]
MSDTILLMDNVTMQFGGVVAVNDLSLQVNRGEIVALIGPNGAGKTTAFNCITGVYEPTNGMISFNGQPMLRNHPAGKMKKLYAGAHADKFTKAYVPQDEEALAAIAAAREAGDELTAANLQAAYDDAAEQRKEQALLLDPHAFSDKVIAPTPDKITKLGIARTFQNIRLFKSQTVFDNVLIAKHMRAKQNIFTATFRLSYKEEKRMREETEALLEEQNLIHLRNELATSLPYGLQRRLEIARALATDPQLLLLDEPAAGMNPQETLELTEFIGQIRKKYNLSIFMIEHHMDLVMEISDRIYVLDFGRLIASGTPDVVQNDQRVIDAYLGVSDDVED